MLDESSIGESEVMASLREILQRPPKKLVECRRCGGSGIVNRRGMVVSDPCPRCEDGKETVTDYDEWEEDVRALMASKGATEVAA